MNPEYDLIIEPSPLFIRLIVAIVILLVFIATFVVLDFELSTKKANTTGEVVGKTLQAPKKSGDFPHILILKKGSAIYHIRVPKDYYNTIEPGAILLLVEERTRFTDQVIGCWLFDGMFPLTQVSKTSFVPRKNNRPVLNSRAVLNPQIHE